MLSEIKEKKRKKHKTNIYKNIVSCLLAMMLLLTTGNLTVKAGATPEEKQINSAADPPTTIEEGDAWLERQRELPLAIVTLQEMLQEIRLISVLKELPERIVPPIIPNVILQMQESILAAQVIIQDISGTCQRTEEIDGLPVLRDKNAPPEAYIGEKTEAKVYDDFQNDIWLQYQQKDLNIGDTAKIRPWRLEQIITDTIHNDVQRPVFHFEVISGDSITLGIEADQDKDNFGAVVTEGTEVISKNYVYAKGAKQGTSVVKVTYEATDYNGGHWDLCSIVNTGYAVFTVKEKQHHLLLLPRQKMQNLQQHPLL